MATEGMTERHVAPPPGPALGPERGALISRFIVVGRLGAGGMGLVLSAYDPALDRKVAIKLIRPDLTEGGNREVRTARLLLEAQAMAKISHRNVIAVHEVGTFGEQVFIAMELVDGQALSAWLEPGRSFAEIRDAFLQAGRGLEAAHALGLVHRDFKPDNVLVGRDGRVRVTDFGVVALVGEAEAHSPALATNLTRPGAAVGTPAYMAPEQSGGGRVDGRADQFAFCVSLCEALTGARPAAGATPADARVPRWLRPVLARGLARRPEDRHPSMAALLGALERGPLVTPRRLLAAGAVLAAASGIVALETRAGPEAPCRGSEARLAGVWDAPRRAAVIAALPGVGRAVAARLDAYAAAWAARRQQVCEATFVHHEQSTDALDLRMACLDGRLRELGALAGELVHADAARAVGAATQLSDLDACDDAVLPLPADPRRRAAAVALDEAYQRAMTLDHLERYGKARELLEAALPTVAEAAYPPAEGRVLTFLGSIRDDVGGKGLDLLTRGVAAAEAGRDDRTRAFGLRELAWLSSVERHYGEAHTYLELARAALARAAGGRADAIHIDVLEGTIYSMEGRHADAIRVERRAVEQSEQLFGAGAYETGTALIELAMAFGAAGQPDEAMAADRRAVAIFEREAGHDSPVVARLVGEQANILYRAGKLEAAVAAYREALAIEDRVLGPDSRDGATTASGIAGALMDLERFDEARPYCRRAIAALEKQYGPAAPILAMPVAALGQLELYSGNPAAAAPILERGIALAEKDKGVQLNVDDTRCQLRLARFLTSRPHAQALAAAAELMAAKTPEDEIARCTRWMASH